jgi:Cys-rich radical ribosomally synthesized peptide
MFRYDSGSYHAMLGSINAGTLNSAATCIAQCTGCMCNCRCSCSGGLISEFEWEVI